MLPMRDGVRLATVVIRPEGSAHPALLSARPTPLRPWTPSAADAGLLLASTEVVYGVPDPGVTVLPSFGVLP
jgi:predicted acyl esterase